MLNSTLKSVVSSKPQGLVGQRLTRHFWNAMFFSNINVVFMFFLCQSHQRSALLRNGGHAGSIVRLPDMSYCVTMETDSFIAVLLSGPEAP